MDTLIAVFAGAIVMLLGVTLGSSMIQVALTKSMKNGTLGGVHNRTEQPSDDYVRDLEKQVVANKELFAAINEAAMSKDNSEDILDKVSELSVQGWKNNTGPIELRKGESVSA